VLALVIQVDNTIFSVTADNVQDARHHQKYQYKFKSEIQHAHALANDKLLTVFADTTQVENTTLSAVTVLVVVWLAHEFHHHMYQYKATGFISLLLLKYLRFTVLIIINLL